MGPLTQTFWKTADRRMKHRIEEAAHVMVDAHMWGRITEILAKSYTDSPIEGRLPHHCTIIEVYNKYSVMAQDAGDRIEYFFLASEQGPSPIPYAGDAVKRSINMHLSEKWKEAQAARGYDEQTLADTLGTIAGKVDVLTTLMAEPRFVIQEPFSRLKRHMAAKKIGKRGLDHTWVKLAWNMDEAVKAKKAPHNPDSPQKPYHLVRAHWRNYGEVKTPHGERREGKEGWWVWIESHHRGHPALGYVKHQYHPRMTACIE